MEETPVTETEQVISSDNLTQASYQETAYADASWEVVGEPPGEEVFLPMEVSRAPGASQMIDPMFADYGGLSDAAKVQRWHLPEGEGVETVADSNQEEEDLIKLREEEIEEIKRQAFEEGHKSAMEGEVVKNAERMMGIEQRLGSMISDLNTQLVEHQRLVEVNAVQFSLDVSKKLLDTAVEINPEYITEIVKEAISNSGAASIKKIRVSPEDLEFISLIGLEKRIKEFDGSWQFEPDSSINAGCVIESSAGEIDYQLDLAWERVKDSVMKVIR